jgi:hypothetical protein
MKRGRPFKQAVVIVETHPVLIKGQIVDIIEEEESRYKVRSFLTAKYEFIDKKDISIN